MNSRYSNTYVSNMFVGKKLYDGKKKPETREERRKRLIEEADTYGD